MSLNNYGYNEVIRKLQEQDEIFHKQNAPEQQLKIANPNLASIELIMSDYYTGSFTTVEELAGEISFILNNGDD